MEKNWLIRTKSNHILGPISKEKVIELYTNGSIKPDDEICSGNGYWFYLREEELLQKYLFGDEVQNFNPISEAKDVLTQSASRMSEGDTEDITLIGEIDISKLDPESKGPKKKNEFQIKVNSASSSSGKSFKRQDYLKYLGILGFIILFLMVYYRKTIIHALFQGEISFISFELINQAHAQEGRSAEKKKLLESSVKLEEITFRPVIGLNGFNIASSFDIEKLNCSNFTSDVYQLGILLYPPEVINEKFLIRMRDCVLNLPDEHILKKWMKWVAGGQSMNDMSLQKSLISDLVNSSYNLITDVKTRTRVMDIIHDIREETLAEIILKSYLYLMIGNVTRSDNLLIKIIQSTPFDNWKMSKRNPGAYFKLMRDLSPQIFKKMENHPSDRKAFQLFCIYLRSFYNDEFIRELALNVDTDQVEDKIGLRYVKSIAPNFIDFLNLSQVNLSTRVDELRKKNMPEESQAYWIWAFLNVDPYITDLINNTLTKIEVQNQLWFIYLMSNEKTADVFSRNKGSSFLPGRRHFLRANLSDKREFMLSLYKLIELGDINSELVKTAAVFITNE